MQTIYRTSYIPLYAQIELVDPVAEEPYRAEQWVEEDAPNGFLGPHGLVVSTMNDVDVEVTVFEGPGQPEGRLGLSGAIQVGAHGLELGTISQRDRIDWPAGWTSVSVFVNAWPGTEVTQVALVLEWRGQELPPASILQPAEQTRPMQMSWQEITNELAVERLVAAVREGASLPGYLGLRALVALGMPVRQQMLALLSDPSSRVRLLTVRALGQSGSEALGLVLNARSPEDRRQALEALDQLAKEVLEPLSWALRDEDAAVRREVALQLCHFGKSSLKVAVAPLMAALNDPDVAVRSSTALALGASEDPRSLEPLVQRLLHRDELPIVRRCAAEGLDYLQDRRATRSLLRVLEEPQEDPEVRVFAARALMHLTDPQAVEVFQRLLRDQQAPTRLRKAADGVGALGDMTVLPILTEVQARLSIGNREEQALKEHLSWAIEQIKERTGA